MSLNPYCAPNEHSLQRFSQLRPPSVTTVSHHTQHRRSSDYTLVHHGRQVRVGPVSFWIVVGTLVVMAVWSVGTGSYFAFKEDVLTRLISRQAEMQFAYEDRVQELRAQVDRVTSRQLLDQEKFEQKLETLMKRQALLEQRTSMIAGEAGAPRGKSGPNKPTPISDNGPYSLRPERQSSWLPTFGRVAA
ncbi:MAG: M23 family peptidase, partial [Pseudolabrys sp.]|nr:M23 family peptidase [Pseudolabrys sp.]